MESKPDTHDTRHLLESGAARVFINANFIDPYFFGFLGPPPPHPPRRGGWLVGRLLAFGVMGGGLHR